MDGTLIYNYAATSNQSFLAIFDATIATIGPDRHGYYYEAANIGTHSIPSGAAMALDLCLWI